MEFPLSPLCVIAAALLKTFESYSNPPYAINSYRHLLSMGFLVSNSMVGF